MNLSAKLCRSAFLVICGFALFTPLQISHTQTQSEMNEEAAQEFAKADADLNKTYKAVMSRMDDESRALLKASQKAWIVYRDAEAQFQSDLEARGGSIYPLTFLIHQTTLTEQRTAELKKILANTNTL